MGNNQAPPNLHFSTSARYLTTREGGEDPGIVREIVSPKDRALFRDKLYAMQKYTVATDTPSRIRYNQKQLEWEEITVLDQSSHIGKGDKASAAEKAEAIRQKVRTQNGATFEDTKARLTGWKNRKRFSMRVTQKFDEPVVRTILSDERKKMLSQEVDTHTHEFELSGGSYLPENNTPLSPQALWDSQISEIPDENMNYHMIFMANIASCENKFGKFIEDKEYADESWKTGANIHQIPNTREVYQGQWKNGKRHGRGDQTWADGSVYQGYWKDDMRNGRGRYMTNDGGLYEGQWRDNTLHGIGKCIYSNGKKYEGGWYNNTKHGTGTEVFADGTIYKGKYVKGIRQGKGQQTWRDGSVYTGEFNQDNMNGYGAMKWADGRRYVGEWKNNMMHGKGVFTWKDGKRFVGEYSENMKNGNGEFEWPDGSKYKGPFLNNKMHGEGTYYTKDDKAKKGIWNQGELVKWL